MNLQKTGFNAEGVELLYKGDLRYHFTQLSDGRLFGFAVGGETGKQSIMTIQSDDLGQTWSESEALFPLSAESGTWGGCQVLVDHDGEIHLFILNDRHSGVFAEPMGEDNKQRMRELGKTCLDIWHTRSNGSVNNWQKPKLAWQGYTGALNSVLQLSNGRILLPFSYAVDAAWRKRGDDIDDFTFWGYYRSTVIYSDDSGKTWQCAEGLKVPVPDISYAYGATEPVAVEREDGKVWMLIRTQMGRFYESLSDDGINWSRPQATTLINSDSPAGLVKLSDNRLVLLWNNCLRFPYAHGGRHVLHAAVSSDNGQTWQGYREVYQDPRNSHQPPTCGDHGTAYPYPYTLDDDTVIFTTGQGEGRVAILKLTPDCLCETEQVDEISVDGLSKWSVFGTEGIKLIDDPEKEENQVLQLLGSKSGVPYAAVRNFPAMPQGRMLLKMLVSSECRGAEIVITDHFSVPFDWEDKFHSLFNIPIAAGDTDKPNTIIVPENQWSEIELIWDILEKRNCEVRINKQLAGTLPLLHESHGGPCYLRLHCSDSDGNRQPGVLISDIKVSKSLS